MKNEDIIMKTRIQLMKNGMIGTTGRKIKIIDNNQQEVEIDEPAEIHTYTAWKRLGFQVPKGTKAKIFIPIWNYQTLDDGTQLKFQRNAPFFTPEQVEIIEDEVDPSMNVVDTENFVFA